MTVKTVNPKIAELVRQNDGFCPCTIEKNDDTECMCKEFRESPVGTVCRCGYLKKVED